MNVDILAILDTVVNVAVTLGLGGGAVYAVKKRDKLYGAVSFLTEDRNESSDSISAKLDNQHEQNMTRFDGLDKRLDLVNGKVGKNTDKLVDVDKKVAVLEALSNK